MKTIAVVVHSLTVEYTLSILNGISDYFKEKDIRSIITQLKAPSYTNSLYEYQSFSSLPSIFNGQVDGLIVVSGIYNTTNTLKTLVKEFSKYKSKPVVSISIPLDLPDCSTVIVDDSKSYEKIITHLHKEHKVRKIAFMGTDPETSTEGKHRFQCFMNAMKKNNLTFDSDLFFYGNFTTSSAEAELQTRLKKKSDVKFDCIVAANDLMALACSKHLSSLGFKIPEDIKIIGYDNTSHSRQEYPFLTTIDQNLYSQGQKAAQLILRKIDGKNVPEITKISSTPVIRESCGCILKINGKLIRKDPKFQLLSNGAQNHFLGKLCNISALFDMTKASDTTRRLFYSLRFMMDHSNIREIAVCYYDKPLTIGRKESFALVSKINLNMLLDLDYGISEFESNRYFDPSKEILPSNVLERAKGTYILHPIYSGELNYGYVLCRIENNDYAVYSVIIRILVTALSQAYEYSNRLSENSMLSEENKQLQENNTSLNKQSKTDELTRLLNRRGFMELGQEHINMSIEANDSGLVFFADLDGLKIINDTYGHKMGDAAIKAAGSVLSQVLRANDVVGRLSGDEFGGVASGMDSKLISKVRAQAEKYCEDVSKQHNFPFKLSISIGFAKFHKENHILKELLEEADKMLYEEKKIKHATRNP